MKNPSWAALAALAPITWGTTYITTTSLLPEGHPLFAALMRSLPAGLIALAASRQLPHGSWWFKSFALGILNMGAFFPLLFIAAQHLPGGVAATLGAIQPLVVLFLAVPLLRQKIVASKIVWALAGVAGVGMVVLGPGAGMDLTGVAAGLGGAACMGLGVVLSKKWGRPQNVSAIGYAGWQLTAAGLALLAPALLIDGVPAHVDAPALAGYLWLGLAGGLLAYTVWFAAIGQLPVASTALLGLLSPLMAAVMGMLLAGESLSGVQIAGFGISIAAMAGGQLPSASFSLKTLSHGGRWKKPAPDNAAR